MKNTTLYGILALVLLVASMTAAYAMWSETLKINVYANTGEVNVKWSTVSTNDEGNTTDPNHDKDVGKCEAVIVNDTSVSNEPFNKINITITNAYPCYNCTVTATVDNIGTIPVKLLSAKIILSNGSEYTLYDAKDDTNKFGQDFNFTHYDVVVNRDETEDQIHPGGNATYTISIHVKQPAEENTLYHFAIEFVFAQWNEVP